MDKRLEHRLCIALVLFAAALRLASASGLDAQAEQAVARSAGQSAIGRLLLPAAGQEQALPEVFPVELLSAPESPDSPAEPPAPEPEPEPPVQTDPEPRPEITFSAQEADAITIAGACTYPVDKADLLCAPLPFRITPGQPSVLIVHTHSCEAYTPEPGWEYEPSDAMRTTDPAHSVIRVGDALAEALARAGIGVIHDTTLNDHPSYDGSYERMRAVIERYLADYPTICMVLDIHRDAAVDERGFPVALQAEVGGETCAQVMLVVGTDQGGLPHPDWRGNLSVALKLQALLGRSAPGLCRDIDLRTERFNQHETPGSLLCEIGSTGNTLREALASAGLLAAALVQLLGGPP